MLQLLLGHVVEDVNQTAVGLDVTLGDGLTDDGLGVTGVVLDQPHHIGLVDVADLHSLNLGNHDLDVIPEQGVAVIGADFGGSVDIIFQTLDEHDTLAVSPGDGDEVSGFGLVGGMAGDIVDALGLVQLSDNKVVVGVVMDDEFNIPEVTLAVGEQLGQLNAVGVDMGIIHQGVIVAGVGTLPGQNDLVGVTLVTEHQGVVGIHDGLIGDPQSAVGVAGVDHGGTGINSLGAVDLSQTSCGHLNGHDGLAFCSASVGDGEEAIGLFPGGNQVGAALVCEELQHNIVLLVGNTLAQSIDEGVAGQVGGLGGDAGQGGNDLIVNDITGGGGAGVGIAVRDVGGGAAVLAGIRNLLTQSLLQLRNAGEVLGEGSHIVDPASAAVGGIGAVDRGHGQAHQEGVDGGDNHLRHGGFHAQVQAKIQIGGLGLTVGIGGSQLHAAVVGHVLLQGILDGGGIGFQAGSQGVDENIGLIEILGFIQLVGIGIPLCTVFQSQCLQEVGSHGLVDPVQDFHVVVGAAVGGGLGELNDVGHLQDAELDTLDGVTVALFAVAQVAGVVVVAVTVGTDEGVVHLLVVHAGGHIAGVPDAVLLGIGQIHLVDGQGALTVKVDGRIRDLGSGNADGERQTGQHCQTQSDCFDKLFHFKSKPFKKCNWGSPLR